MQPDPTDLNEISTEDIAELAGVTSAAVSNWVKREPDFPKHLHIVGRRTLYSRTAVMAWLERNDKLPANADGQWQADLWRLADTARGAVRYTDLIEALAWTTAYLHNADSVPEDAAELVERAVSADNAANGLYRRLATADTMPMLFDQIKSTASRLAEHNGQPLEQLLALAVDRDRSIDGGAGQLLIDDLVDAACIGQDDHVLDINAGVGALLRRISDRTGNKQLAGRFESVEAKRVAEAVNAARKISVDTELGSTEDMSPHRAKFNRIVGIVAPLRKPSTHAARQPDPVDPRWQLAVPPAHNSWAAILQDALWNLAPDGVAVFAVSDYDLTREAAAAFRVQMVQSGVVTAIIRTEHLLPGARLRLSFLIVRRPTEDWSERSTVLMVDLTDHARNDRGADWHLWINGGATPDDPRCTSVEVADLIKHNAILDARRYIPEQRPDSADAVDLAALLPATIDDASDRVDALADFVQLVHIPGFDPNRNAWRSTTIGALADDKMIHIATGRTRGSNKLDDGHPVLTAREVAGRSGRSPTLCDPEERSATQIVRTGDLVIQLEQEPGRSITVTDEHDGWVLGGGLVRIRPDRNGTTTELGWIAAWTASPTFRYDCARLSVGMMSVQRLRPSDLRRIEIPMPPPEVQRAAAAYNELIADLEAASRSAIRAVDHLIELSTELLAAHLREPVNQTAVQATLVPDRAMGPRRRRSAAAERLHSSSAARGDLHLAPTHLNATGRPVGSKFEVDAGAQARSKATASLSASNQRLREQLINDGLLVERSGHLELTERYLFDSPTAAASTLTGTNTNGLISWMDDQGRTLKQLTADDVEPR
jgi:SAM-dependent methyltransferase/predicted DNA-binding transcriptional regulator AlpA